MRKKTKLEKKKVKKRKIHKGVLTPLDDNILNTSKAKIELRRKDEVFVRVSDDFQTYFISNDGRVAHKNPDKTYNVLSETKSSTGRVHNKLCGYIEGEPVQKDFNADDLVAMRFLEEIDDEDCDIVYHIDGDIGNSYYKNLMYVTNEERTKLKNGHLNINDIKDRQKYISFATGYREAVHIYNGIFLRTIQTSEGAYKEATLSDKWLKNPDSFVRWYEKNYYECDGEPMVVDKDLLSPGNKEYSEDKCCILPQTLNVMLSNCKKHRAIATKDLPLGVRCDSAKKKNRYYAEIKPFGNDELKKLSYWKTPIEAFTEYKRFKQADILMMALKYKNKIPEHIFEALLKVDVKPYCDGDPRNDEYEKMMDSLA